MLIDPTLLQSYNLVSKVAMLNRYGIGARLILVTPTMFAQAVSNVSYLIRDQLDTSYLLDFQELYYAQTRQKVKECL